MRRHRREKITYNYECTITGEGFVTTVKAPNPKELVSVKAYYELHPDMDDRPAIVKKRLGFQADAAAADAAASEVNKH